jgi:phi13 family phage major tail protein
MAKTGLKHVVGAVLNESGTNPAYTAGKIIGKAITANVSIEVTEALLYADDTIAESIKKFKSGKISLNVDDLDYPIQAMLLGHTVATNTLTASGNDVAPFVGIGFYGSVVRSGVTKYRAVWLGKCQFAEPSDESKTKGESIEFSTPTIEGTVMKLKSGVWKEETTVDTETAALTWLNGKASITGA